MGVGGGMDSCSGGGMTRGEPGSAGGAHSGGMDSCLRRNDEGGWEGSIKEMGFGVDCLGGAGTIVDCLVSRGGFGPRGTR